MKLSDLDHLRAEDMIKFKEEIVNGKSVTIVSYMIANTELWKLPLALECRGITFDTLTGECICRPFEKFFNIGENAESLPTNLKWNSVTAVLEKKDGSMLSPILLDDTIYWKTKKSFYSDVAIEANKNATAYINDFAKHCINLGFTPIFEYTSPNFEIVINYGKQPQFTLLALRNIQTGKLVPHDELFILCADERVNIITSYDTKVTFEQLSNQLEGLTNVEGYVIRFDDENGTQYKKIKSDWYKLNHRAKTELRERDVFDMVLDETIDDIKSIITAAGLSLEPIELIERKVAGQLSDIIDEVAMLLKESVLLPSRRDVAMTYNTNPLFGLLMTAYSGKEPDYKKYLTNNCRIGYSLHTIYSNFKRDAE